MDAASDGQRAAIVAVQRLRAGATTPYIGNRLKIGTGLVRPNRLGAQAPSERLVLAAGGEQRQDADAL